MTNKNKVLLGILGAAAAGVAIGLLIAPEKGKDIRKKIKQTAGDWADTVSHLFHRGERELENVKDKARSAKSVAEDKVNRIKESLS